MVSLHIGKEQSNSNLEGFGKRKHLGRGKEVVATEQPSGYSLVINCRKLLN